MIKICVICQEAFEAKGNTKTCSLGCMEAKWKAYIKAYHQLPKAKATRKAYAQSHEGKATRKAYQQTPQWKAYQKAYNKAYKQRRKEEQEASLMFQVMAFTGGGGLNNEKTGVECRINEKAIGSSHR